MSSEPETVDIRPARKKCGVCRKTLRTLKTRTRRVIDSSGAITVREVTLHCPVHREDVFPPDDRLAPPGSQYSFDLVAEIGRLRYLEHKQVGEIREEMMRRDVSIPRRTVYWLCERFLQFVVAVHIDSMPLIREAARKRGGYVLHVDGTWNKGGTIMLMDDGWSGIRLLSARVPSEGAEHLIPVLEVLKKRLGQPVAVVRDMSDGIDTAIRKVFPDAYVITCHYHFLRDVGMKMFEPLYKSFRNRIDRRGVKGRLRALRRALKSGDRGSGERSLALELVEYILDYEREGRGLAYPFSLPAVSFYRRCEEVAVGVRKEILANARDNRSSPLLSRLENSLRLLKPPPAVMGRLHADFVALEERWRWFERVRCALRYRNGPVPLSTRVHLSEKELEKGRWKLDRLLLKIDRTVNKTADGHHERELRRALRKVSSLIRERREELLAPNVAVDVGGKTAVRRLPRTNAQVEEDFRRLRRHGRRIRGNSDVEPQVQREGAGMLIALNLENREYVRLVYGGVDRIGERFSKASPDAIKMAKSLMACSEAR